MNVQDTTTFNQAVALANAGQKTQAYSQLRALLPTNTTSANLLLWLAFTSPYIDESEKLINQAITIDPGNPAIDGARAWLAQEKVKYTPISPPPAFVNPQAFIAPQQEPIPIPVMPILPPKKPVAMSHLVSYFFGCLIICALLGIGAGYAPELYVNSLIDKGNDKIDQAATVARARQIRADTLDQIDLVHKFGIVVPIALVVITAFWVLVDSPKYANSFPRNYQKPPLWFLSSLLMWIIFFPLYLTLRHKVKLETP